MPKKTFLVAGDIKEGLDLWCGDIYVCLVCFFFSACYLDPATLKSIAASMDMKGDVNGE